MWQEFVTPNSAQHRVSKRHIDVDTDADQPIRCRSADSMPISDSMSIARSISRSTDAIRRSADPISRCTDEPIGRCIAKERNGGGAGT
jgi:hypothetical protein